MKGRYYLLSLGCPKNTVESEHLAGLLQEDGWEPTSDPAQAQLLLVNTCGFVREAVDESLDAILALAAQKTPGQQLVVVGCLVGRYGYKLARALPEAELLVAPSHTSQLPKLIMSPPPARIAIGPPRGCMGLGHPRAISTGPGWAYMRIAEGCPHRCHYCTIPAIRGPLRSRPINELVAEAWALAKTGVKELVLVAQDTGAYGQDLGMDHGLAGLLKALDSVEPIRWIRVMYLHPATLSPQLAEAIATCERVLPYLDMPLQHIHPRVLKLMGRPYTQEIAERLQWLRSQIPGIVLRTTLMVGHPGEDERAFEELVQFVKEFRFEYLGVFTYQPEAGTRSARHPAPDPAIARERKDLLLGLQAGLSRQWLRSMTGTTQDVLYLGAHPDSELVGQARGWWQAPEVDGEAIVVEGTASPGELLPARVVRAHTYDVEVSLG